MKVVFFGTPHFVVPVLHSLLNKFDVVGIVTAPDKKAGRDQKLMPSPVKAAYHNYLYNTSDAQKTPAVILTPNTIDQTVADTIKNLRPEIFVTAAYGKILPKFLLDIPTLGALNVHPSLLPLHRGPSPIQQTLLEGDEITGVCIMKMDQEMDHGPLLKSISQEVHSTDTFTTLTTHLFERAAEILPEIINDFASGKINPVTQNHEKATYSKIIKKDDGFFDIENPPVKEELERMTRAYYPWPGVWTRLRQDFGGQALNGKIIKFLPFGRVQMEGKKPTPLKDFLNGYPQLKEKLEPLLQ